MSSPANRPAAVLILRPLGYFAILLVWLALLGLVGFVLVGPFFAIDAGYGDEGGLSFAIENLVILVIVSPIIGPALGFGFVVSAASAALAGLAFVRSLRPANAGRKLTLTVSSRSTVGPQGRIGATATSLLPTSSGRVDRRIAAMSLSGMHAPARLVLASAWFAGAWLLVLGAARWTLTGFSLVVAIVVAIAFVVLGGRATRRAYARPGRTARAAAR